MGAVAKLIGLGMPGELAKVVGTTVQTLAGTGTSLAAGKSIRVNYALLTTDSGQTAFTLSTDWAIGDEVTVVNTSATAALVFPQSGGAIDAGSTDASVSIAQNESRSFTKVSSTSWRSGEAVESVESLTASGAVTAGSFSTTGGTSVRTGTAVPASAGAVAAGPAVTLFSSGPSMYVTSDTPTFTAVKGSICINTGGSGTSNRAYITTTAGTWTAFVTVA